MKTVRGLFIGGVLLLSAAGCQSTPEPSVATTAEQPELERSEIPGIETLIDGPLDQTPTGLVCECEDEVGIGALFNDEDEGMMPMNMREIGSAQQVDMSARIVPFGAPTPQVFFGNLHGHTSFSDGVGTPREAFEHARDNGKLDFLALTEHNHTSALGSDRIGIGKTPDLYDGPAQDSLINTAESLTVSGTFVALYGQEVSSISQGNHFNVFDIPHVVDDVEVPNGAFDKLVNDWLPANPDSFGEMPVVQMNHPWSSSSNNDKEYGRDDFPFEEWRTKIDGIAQLIEVANGPGHSTGTGLKPGGSPSEWRRYLNLGFHLAPTANQDNHHKTWGTITDARTAVVATSLSKAGVLEALKQRNVYATLDRNLRIIATVNGALIGSIVQGQTDGEDLAIEVSIRDDDEGDQSYWIEIFADNATGENDTQNAKLVTTYGPLETTSNEGDVWTLNDLEYDGWQYLYMRVKEGPEGDLEKQAWLAPIWFR